MQQFLQQASVSSYENNSPLTDNKRQEEGSSPKLGKFCQETGKLLQKDKRTGMRSDWESFKEAQRRYEKTNRHSK